METKLKVIADTADISLDEARLALELSDGDVERALEMVPYVEKSMIVVQGKFVCGRTTKLYGIFRLLGEGREGQLLDFGLAISYNLSDVDSPISANPEAFRKVVDQLFIQTETSQLHTFLTGFYENLGAAQINQIYHFIKKDDRLELTNFLAEIVGKIWGGSERVEVSAETFLFTKVQCQKKGLIEADVEETDSDESGDPNLTIYLETEPIISAVKGKTIEKFKLDELIPLRVIDSREAGRYLGQILSNDDGLAIGVLKDVYYKELSNRYVATVEFGPKINGRFMIDSSVRLATYTDIPQKEIVATSEEQKSSPINSTYIMSLLIIFLLILILFFTR